MARISTYFAKGSITPDDRGATAFEQAARRVGSFYDQIARGDNIVARDIGDLWNQAKFNALAADTEARAAAAKGGGVNFRVLGAQGGGGRGTVIRGGRGGGGGGGGYNAGAARGIGQGAASLGTLAERLINGQGLTDAQYQQLGLTPAGRAFLDQFQGQPNYQINTNPKTGGIAPNPDITDKEAAAAGFNMDAAPQYGSAVPTYPAPSPMDILGLPNLNDKNPNELYDPELARIQAGGPEATPGDVNAQPWENQPGGVAPGGSGIWNGIVNTVGTLGGLWPMGNQAPAAPSQTNIVDTSDNAME